MITPAYSPTATERVLPRMALDFTTGILDPRVTVARALNTATRVNSSGFIETVNANLPRFDYDRSTLAPKGLLIETTRANLVLQSADVSQAAWAKVGTGVALAPVVTPNAGISPDGTNNAVRVQFDCTNASSLSNRSRIQQSVTLVTSTTYSEGVWVKAYDPSNVGKTVRFLVEGVSGTFTYTLTDQWVRISPASGAATGTSGTFMLETRGTVTTQTADILMWNATLEAGAFLTSDIITGATSLTRNVDQVAMTGTNFSDWYNQSEGAFAAEYIPPTIATTLGVLSVNDGTTNNRIDARSNGTSFVTSGGATQAIMVATGAVANAINRCVVGYKLNSFAFAVNGNAPATDTSGSIPTVSRLVIGAVDNFSPSLNGHMRKLRYWPLRITNAEVQAFSK